MKKVILHNFYKIASLQHFMYFNFWHGFSVYSRYIDREFMLEQIYFLHIKTEIHRWASNSIKMKEILNSFDIFSKNFKFSFFVISRKYVKYHSQSIIVESKIFL